MTLPVGTTDTSDPSHWVDDLVWHRQSYRQSKFRWWDNEPVLVASEFTGGRHSFTSVDGLRELEEYRLTLGAYVLTCQRAMGLAMKDSRTGLGLAGWGKLAHLVDLDARRCEESAHLATWAYPYDQREISNPQVRRIEAMCAGFFFANPLLLTWELRQLWGLYYAAEQILEDTVVDLVEELLPTTPTSVLASAVGLYSEHGLRDRIFQQRSTRGAVGDSRRTLRQTFGPTPNATIITAG